MPVSRIARTASAPTIRHARLVALLLTLVAIAALIAVPDRAAVAAKPPPNPTDGQLSGAAAKKAAVAAEVGRLGASVAAMQSQLRQLEAAKEMAEQKLAFALSKLQDAKAATAAAQREVVAAREKVDAAQQQFSGFVQSTYMNGSIGGVTGSLLTATDPNALLQQNSLEQYESDHQINAIGNVKRATVARSNAEAAARLALARQRSLAQAAKQAKLDADAAVVSAIAQQHQLQQQLASQQAALQQAQEQLATLNNQRAAFIQWQRRQAAIAAAQARARRLAAERARAAALAAAAAQRRHDEAVAAAERRRAAALRHHQGSHRHVPGSTHSNGGSNGGSSAGPNGGGYPIPASGGGWTPAKGWEAVARAKRWLGWMYAWAGGNAYGPTYGVCAGDGAYNDCHIRGFDCSGLSLYAWAPFMQLDHYAASQYWSAGSFHPSTSQLQPGDLVFWSSNGSPSGIHHVAIYIGGGSVIQAPQSGSVIQITPLWSVDWGYLGATRPLT
ncbi:MAG TPA: NlpC/P60 family protein [Jatrophihabitans sp.]